MRKALTWLAGAVGLAALARLLSRRQPVADATTAADPAEELRQRLAEQRREVEAAPAEQVAEQAVEVEEGDVLDPAPSGGLADLEERRARVHARAQEALELMRDDGDGDGPGGGAVA